MNERSLQGIRKHLQTKDAQERIRQNMQRGREEATVTIGRAARLFGFTENQLRDWEERGLLKPLRPTGQRQYSPDELDKLAIIKELIAEGGYSPGAIPPDIDRIWCSISSKQQDQTAKSGGEEAENLYIDQRVERTYDELFWRYYASHVLHFSLMLISEDIPNTIVGLVLPLQHQDTSDPIQHPRDLAKISECLIGWLGRNRMFNAFLASAPSFEYPTDFRVATLPSTEENIPKGNIWVVVQRKAKPLTPSMPVIETIRRLLTPLYDVKVENWRSYFGRGMRDFLYEVTDLSNNTSPNILNDLADMIVRLGGQQADGQNRWRFCCILVPENSALPLQQRSLVVRAQSEHAPHRIGVTTISPNDPLLGISLRAFQSGHVAYRHEISAADTTIALHEVEGPIRSAIAVPIGGENGMPVAALYIVSDEADAFTEGDQRVLRITGRMLEELLMTYHARLRVTEHLGDLIKKPSVIDALFSDFFSEIDFTMDVENLLKNIQLKMDRKNQFIEKHAPHTNPDTHFKIQPSSEEAVSFIGIDIDNQSKLANKYGDQMMRNLGREVGQRVQEQLRVLFTEHVDCRLYHVYADRFYLLLKGISLEQAREKAKRIKLILKGPYQLDALHPSIEEPTRPDSMHVLSVSVRLGVTSYPYVKLEDLLQRYTAATAVANVRATISRDLDRALEKGRIDGGDVVISWEPDIWGYVQLH